MKPWSHAIFAVVVTVALLYFFVPSAAFTWQVLLLAGISGFLPDFDHRQWIWVIIAIAAIAALFFFFANSLEYLMPGQYEVILLFAAGTAVLIGWVLYATKPLYKEFYELPQGVYEFGGSGTQFLILYTLLVFAGTLSALYAFVAFFAFASHWVLDQIAWKTRLGRRFLVDSPDWNLSFEDAMELHKQRQRRKAEKKY